jgi:hypothetical protein
MQFQNIFKLDLTYLLTILPFPPYLLPPLTIPTSHNLDLVLEYTPNRDFVPTRRTTAACLLLAAQEGREREGGVEDDDYAHTYRG